MTVPGCSLDIKYEFYFSINENILDWQKHIRKVIKSEKQLIKSYSF